MMAMASMDEERQTIAAIMADPVAFQMATDCIELFQTQTARDARDAAIAALANRISDRPPTGP